jgi:DNA replication protein DnaC
MSLRVPPRFAEADLSHVDRTIFAPVFDYATKIDVNVKGGMGLLLSGPNGPGKTHSLVALTREALRVATVKKRFFDYEFVTAPDFFERIPTFEDRQVVDSRRNQSWFETFTKVPWLVLDDLGKEFREGGFHAQVVYKLGRVLRARNGRQLVTHITTNNHPSKGNNVNKESLHSVYGESIMSLLSEMTKAYVIQGPDRRKQRNGTRG